MKGHYLTIWLETQTRPASSDREWFEASDSFPLDRGAPGYGCRIADVSAPVAGPNNVGLPFRVASWNVAYAGTRRAREKAEFWPPLEPNLIFLPKVNPVSFRP